MRAGILILILGLRPSPGSGPNSQTMGIMIMFRSPKGQKLILILFVGLLGPGLEESERPGIRIRIPALKSHAGIGGLRVMKELTPTQSCGAGG
jgi:hypothetical protein